MTNSLFPRFDGSLFREYRDPIMGLAILIIVVFHFHPEANYLHLIDRYGWAGVDMFIFVSAIGLCYSLSYKPQLLNFFKRRIVRIIPTWWLFLTGIVVVSLIAHKSHPGTIVELLCYYTGIGWWLNGLFDAPMFVYYYEWYVPTQLGLYLIFPLLFYIPRKYLPLVWTFILMCVELMLRKEVLVSIYFSYSRLLTFLTGILFFKFFIEEIPEKVKSRGYGHYVALCMLVIAILLRVSGLIKLMVFFSLIMPFTFYILASVLKAVKINGYPVLSYIGTISLEIYLVHVYWHVPTIRLGGVILDGDMLLVPKIIISILLAIALKYTIKSVSFLNEQLK